MALNRKGKRRQEMLQEQNQHPKEILYSTKKEKLLALRLLLIVIVSIFVGDVVIMAALHLARLHLPLLTEMFVDGFILIVLIIPMLYKFVFQSMLLEIVEHKRAEEKIRNLNEELEQRVQERTAELLKAKDAAEVANRAKSKFLANISHELRTPLNAVLGYAHILKRTENLPEQHVKGLEIIKISGEHLLHIINTILDLTKIEDGHITLQMSECDFPEFLNTIAAPIRLRATQKGLAFVAEWSPEIPAGICVDAGRLREVLMNLLDNAVKFTEKGRVTFRVGVNLCVHPAEGKHVISRVGVNLCVHPAEGKHVISRVGVNLWVHPAEGKHVTSRGVNLWVHPAEGKHVTSRGVNLWVHPAEGKHTGIAPTHIIRFEVEDTGIGIAPEHLEEIFLPFQQIGDIYSSVTGIKLGLAMSRKLVGLMGSELHVKSTLGIGSTFWFELTVPAVPGFVSKTTPETPTMIGSQGERRTAPGGDVDSHPQHISTLFPLLPQEDREMLLRLTQRGNVKGILEQLNAIERLGEQFRPLVTELRRLASQFQIDEIGALLEEATLSPTTL
jgi:signal transduction histidine kinase